MDLFGISYISNGIYMPKKTPSCIEEVDAVKFSLNSKTTISELLISQMFISRLITIFDIRCLKWPFFTVVEQIRKHFNANHLDYIFTFTDLSNIIKTCLFYTLV